MTGQIASLLADLRGTHETDEQIRASDLFKSMEVAGFDPAHPVKVRKSDGLLICGYHRTRCAEMLGLEPVKLFIDCTDEEAIQIAVRDNTYTAPITMDRRKAIARELYPAHTMQALADMLDVSKKTISLWLEDLIVTQGNNSARPKTATNPKGAGRPKKQRTPKHPREVEDRAARMKVDDAMTYHEVVAATGLSEGTITKAKARLLAVREARAAEPIIDPATLSLSAQEKLAAAVRQHKKELYSGFQQELENRISKWVDDVGARHFIEQYEKIKFLIEHRSGVMTSRHYALVLSCLHPDSRHSLSDEKMAEAFRLFAALKHKLCDNKEVPVNFRPIPTTRAEWEARRKSRSSKASTNRPVSQA